MKKRDRITLGFDWLGNFPETIVSLLTTSPDCTNTSRLCGRQFGN